MPPHGSRVKLRLRIPVPLATPRRHARPREILFFTSREVSLSPTSDGAGYAAPQGLKQIYVQIFTKLCVTCFGVRIEAKRGLKGETREKERQRERARAGGTHNCEVL